MSRFGCYDPLQPLTSLLSTELLYSISLSQDFWFLCSQAQVSQEYGGKQQVRGCIEA
jgi:hypothetical protein